MPKKVCILFVPSMSNIAQDYARQLESEGCMVCLTEVSADAALAVQSGQPSGDPAIEQCLSGAEAKVILLPTGKVPPQLQSGIAAAAASPGRLAVIYETDAEIPQEAEDLANSVVPVGCPVVIDAIIREDIWQTAEGKTPPPRKPKRVKCQ
ncbi:MAG: hypothetical protein EOP37_07195 [Rubrivivax sp.]|nr:MAG: hypothetical protein EOP37_07195 [Rubrivivax sp.]